MLKFVESKHIDPEKWTKLEEQSAHSFGCRAYFEPLSMHWGAIVLGDYEAALVLPYKTKMAWSWVYTPHFYRASYWLGAWSAEAQQEALNLLQQKFPFGQLNIGSLDDNLGEVEKKMVHQVIDPQGFNFDALNKLAKRMVKKAEQQNFTFTTELHIDHFVDFLRVELSDKIDSFRGEDLQRFEQLILSLSAQNMLHFEGALEGGKLLGGLLVVVLPNRHLYLKGTATFTSKKQGLYYLLMHRAIARAIEKDVVFDFGGSQVDGVANFNRNFGAQDEFYTQITWGREPLSYKLMKKIWKIWRKIKK
jgi:hypothetical protein